MHATPYEKECELNRKGRKQNPAIRYYQVTSEKNLKDNIMPYIKYQSMSLKGHELDHKLNALAQLITHIRIGHKIIYISLDFRKWCQMFRYEDTATLFKIFDSIFGLKCQYESTHRLYESALITYQLNYKTCHIQPNGEPVRGKTGHRQHKGDFEGLRQKRWTIFKFARSSCTHQGMDTTSLCLGRLTIR